MLTMSAGEIYAQGAALCGHGVEGIFLLQH